ncbi:MAG TPA: cupin domain-containing protein [Rhodanobacteraceae bacterium]|nr:cupin domain-containing protein [Rhodanobacteraceae bacterium]
MKHKTLSLKSDFEVAFAVRKVQAAEMTLASGSKTGGPDNRHSGADQWLYVVSGNGLAIVDGVEQRLRPGTLLVIERGEAHEIRCTGDEPLRTVNFYSPPAYGDDGEPLPAGEG